MQNKGVRDGERAHLFLLNVAIWMYHCRPLTRPLLLCCNRRHLCMSRQYAQKTMNQLGRLRYTSDPSHVLQHIEQQQRCNWDSGWS